MLLKNCTLEESVLECSELIKEVGQIDGVKMFHNEEYGRDYDVYYLKSQNKEFILKRCHTAYEADILNFLKLNHFKSIPRVKTAFIHHHKTWLVMDMVNSKHLSFNDTEKLIIILSKLHTQFRADNTNDYKPFIKRWQSKEVKLDLFKDKEFTIEEKLHIEESYQRLKAAFVTLIHDDMIPLNVLSCEGDVTVIDWEHAKYGPYILDLGRLLGDYHKDKMWINPDDTIQLLKKYYHQIKKTIELEYDDFQLDFLYAKIHNYFSIVLAHKKNSWAETEWYQLNLKALKKTIKDICNYRRLPGD